MAASVTVTGLDEATRSLEGVEERLSNMRPVLRVVAEDLKAVTDDSFRESRSPSGTPWKPLSPATIKKRRQGSSKPLVDTGNLRNSISARASRKAIRFGTNTPYAPPHQFGGEHIPARPYLPVTESGSFMDSGPAAEFVDDAEETIRHWILTGEIR